MPPVDRVLRIVSIIALAALVVFYALAQLPLQTGGDGSDLPNNTDLFLAGLPGLLVNLVGQTTFALCLGVGVAALVVCIQRRQRGWVIGLLIVLLVAANGSYLVLDIAPLLGDGQFFAYTPLISLLPSALAPLAVLMYTFFAPLPASAT
jgi:hypothetical protein